ncbi:hypothetical protein [Microbacterium maritypicum]|nr:hypothetical protein [Microbacterium liquefaciens]
MSDLLDLLAEMEAPRRDCGHLIPMDNYALGMTEIGRATFTLQ